MSELVCPDIATDEKVWTKPEQQVPPGKAIAFVADRKWVHIPYLFAIWQSGAAAAPLSFRLPEAAGAEALRRIETIDNVEGLATLLFTSGSTGTPKIATATLEQHLYNAKGALPFLNLQPGDRWLLSLPLFHVGGIAILVRCALAGAAVVVSDLPMAEAIFQHRVTHLSLVPTQLYRLLHLEKSVLLSVAKQLKCILIGGAPIPTDLIQKAAAFGLPVHQTYGMTEMCSMITMGKVLPYREMKIAADGEVLVKGQTLFEGYLGQKQTGWFATGDLGRLTENGDFTFIGRKDNLFISGGENIQPEEIEGILMTMPGVIEAYVVPISDPEFGSRPVAFIYSLQLTFEEIQERLRDRLPKFKIPIRFHPLQEGTDLKLSRQALQKAAAAHLV